MTASDIVVDTNVFIVSLLDESQLDVQGQGQRPLAAAYIDGLEAGDYLIHLPRIALIEIVGVTRRESGPATAAAVKNRLSEWISLGLIQLYDLEEERMLASVELVLQANRSKRRWLSAPDANFICLAEELGVPLVSFEKYFESVSDRALVPR